MRWLKHLKQLQKTQVLILDDLGLEPLSNAQCNDLLEIIEDRYEQSSTIVVSQFPVDKWHGLMENPTPAEAILDRLVHNTHRLVLQGESMRKNKLAVESDEKKVKKQQEKLSSRLIEKMRIADRTSMPIRDRIERNTHCSTFVLTTYRYAGVAI